VFNNYSKIKFPLWLVFVFMLALFIWYSPILLKGYPVQQIDQQGTITMARNYLRSGVLGSENDLNVVVAPSLVKSEANITSLGNKLTIFSHTIIFKIFGYLTWEQVVFLVIAIHALSLIFFSITIFYLFGFKESIIFSLIYILLPVNWRLALTISNYEFALLFFSLFTILFFGFKNYKHQWFFLILSGLFLGLAGLAKEAMFLSFPIIFFWLFYYKEIKKIFLVFVPVFLLLLLFWLPSFLGGNNDYLKLFVQTELAHSDFQNYSHAYIDPYTYHFDKESVSSEINESVSNHTSGWLYYVSRLKAGANMGIRQVNIVERLSVGTVSLAKQISKFMAIEDIGGPFIFLLMIIGFYHLKQRDKNIYFLFFIWPIFVVFLLSYAVLGVRNHLMDFSWIIAALVSLGLVGIEPFLKNYYQFGKNTKLFYIFVIFITLYSLVLANHVQWGRSYDDTQYLATKYLAEKIVTYPSVASGQTDNKIIIGDNEVIAVGRRTLHPGLNYLTEKSVVFFSPESVNKLVKNKQLQEAFDKFNIKYIIGYSEEVSDLIIENSNAKNIAIWPRPEDIQLTSNYNKNWFLNVIK